MARGCHTEEARAKLRIARIGKHNSEESKHKAAEAMRQQWQNPEFRTRMSEAHKGEANPLYGKSLSIETRIKIGNTNWR